VGKDVTPFDVDFKVAEPHVGLHVAHGPAGQATHCVDNDVDGSESVDNSSNCRSNTGRRDDVGVQSKDLGRGADGCDGLRGLFKESFIAADQCNGFGAGCGPGTCDFLCEVLA
jgi:hypothetical protein